MPNLKDKQLDKELEKKLFGAESLSCCKVCQCTNGKKIWCACHRKQIREAINTHYISKASVEEVIKSPIHLRSKDGTTTAIKYYEEWEEKIKPALLQALTQGTDD